jgi:hypothetical protein
MVVMRTDTDLMFRHPAFPQDWVHNNLSGEFEFSFEFASFLFSWGLNAIETVNPYVAKNSLVATRRGCYNPILIDSIGALTDQGKKAYTEARLSIIAIREFYQECGAPMTNHEDPNTFQGMDEIIIYGAIPLKCTRILNQAYKLEHTKKDAVLISDRSWDVKFDVTEILPKDAQEPKKYLNLNVLRRHPKMRPDFEKLVKYGLIELTNLPKHDHQRGRGRAPVGASVTPLGKRFYDLFLDKLDPMLVKNHELAEEFMALKESGEWS